MVECRKENSEERKKKTENLRDQEKQGMPPHAGRLEGSVC